MMGLREEGTEQAKEAVAIFEQLGNTLEQVQSLIDLAHLLRDDKQLGAAEDAASRAVTLVPAKGQEFLLCESHRLLGAIYKSKRDTKKAIYHFEVALGIASASNWHGSLFWIYYNLAELFRDDGRFDEAHAHVEHTKSHAVDSAYNLGRATELEAKIWYKQHRFEEARSEALRATDVYQKLGYAVGVENCRVLLKRIEEGLNAPTSSGRSGSSCEFLQTVPSLARSNLPL